MSQPYALVFDLDGTLVHSLPDIHRAVGQLLEEQGKPPLDLATVQRFVGNGVPTLVRRVAEATVLGTDIHTLTVRMLQIYGASSADLTRPYPGVIAALEHFRNAGHPMAVCTNKPEGPARHILEVLDMAQFFQAVVGGDTLPQRKPDPTPLHHTFALLKLRGGVFVGDSEVDAATAQAAGVPFALFSQGYRKSPMAEIPHRWAFDAFDSLVASLPRADLPAV